MCLCKYGLLVTLVETGLFISYRGAQGYWPVPKIYWSNRIRAVMNLTYIRRYNVCVKCIYSIFASSRLYGRIKELKKILNIIGKWKNGPDVTTHINIYTEFCNLCAEARMKIRKNFNDSLTWRMREHERISKLKRSLFNSLHFRKWPILASCLGYTDDANFRFQVFSP